MTYYDRDYYENGLATGKSVYENYRWIPELTVPLAMRIIDYVGIKRGDTVLDFGCAKGYLVKAMRWLGREAYGYDISEYAVRNADAEVKQYIGHTVPDMKFKYCIAKDVLEHIEEEELGGILNSLIDADVLFAIIPFGENGIYHAQINNYDKSHVLCHSHDWWLRFFMKNGWSHDTFSFKVDGIKDKYYGKYPCAHGFFLLNRNGK